MNGQGRKKYTEHDWDNFFWWYIRVDFWIKLSISNKCEEREEKKNSSNFMHVFLSWRIFNGIYLFQKRVQNGAKENITKEYITQPKKIK